MINGWITAKENTKLNLIAEMRLKKKQLFFILKGFIKPFRLLSQLSAFSNLTILYKILTSLGVTSCSAERALSKEKIIKYSLRSVMLDEWLSAMMILASEKDILEKIENEKIVDKLSEKSFAYSSLIKK